MIDLKLSGRSTADEGSAVEEVLLEEVLPGIAIGDPSTLKAVQILISLIGLVGFFLALRLTELLSYQDLPPLAWIYGVVHLSALVGTGYAGVRRSSCQLLLTFGVLAAMIGLLLFFFLVIWIMRGSANVEQIMVQSMEVLTFVVMVYYAKVLHAKAAHGSILTSKDSLKSEEYELLGLPMMDIAVFRATLVLFTSNAITFVIFGLHVVYMFESTIFGDDTTSSARAGYVTFVSVWMTLALSAYFGVKRSSTGLLGLHFCIAASLASLLIIELSSLLLGRRTPHEGNRSRAAVITAGFALVLASSASSAQVLRAKVYSGVNLTKLTSSLDGPESKTVGRTAVDVNLTVTTRGAEESYNPADAL